MADMKECAICGGFFYPNRAYQKYCSECRNHPERKKKQYEIAVSINMRHAGQEKKPIEQICKQCGKLFKFPKERKFCSDRCTKQNAIENARCSQCGVRLLDLGIEVTPNSHNLYFCSERCRNEHMWAMAEKRGNIHICKQCGKKFVRKNGGTFCSRQCYQDAAKAGWIPQKKEKRAESPFPKEIAICKQCGKPFSRIAGSVYDQFCSNDCRKANTYQKQKEKLSKQKEEAKKEAAKQQEKGHEEVLKKGLCWKCKTPYPDCERMSSKFQYSPEGSVFEKGKIIRCPKYVG